MEINTESIVRSTMVGHNRIPYKKLCSTGFKLGVIIICTATFILVLPLLKSKYNLKLRSPKPTRAPPLTLQKFSPPTLFPVPDIRQSWSMHKSIELAEKPRLLNLTNFQWIINNPKRCESASSKRVVLVLIQSLREHSSERDAIRKTWLSVKDSYENWDVRGLFLLGEPADRTKYFYHNFELKSLENESLTHGDIVLGNYRESFKNRSYQHMMGYKWAINFCQNADFVITLEDNMFLDIFAWLDWRKAARNRADFSCIVFSRSEPVRKSNDVFYVSKNDWPEQFFPDYCSGLGYITDIESIAKVYSVSHVNSFVWVSDALVTGILRRKAEKAYGWKTSFESIWENVTLVDKGQEWLDFCREFELGDMKDRVDWSVPREFGQLVKVPDDNVNHDLHCLWKKINFDRKHRIKSTTSSSKKAPVEYDQSLY